MHNTSAIASPLPCADIIAMDAVTIPKLAPEACHESRPTPELCLLAAVMQMALRDLQKPRYRDEAQAFIKSENFALFCEWLGWDAEDIRQAAVEGVAPHRIA